MDYWKKGLCRWASRHSFIFERSLWRTASRESNRPNLTPLRYGVVRCSGGATGICLLPSKGLFVHLSKSSRTLDQPDPSGTGVQRGLPLASFAYFAMGQSRNGVWGVNAHTALMETKRCCQRCRLILSPPMDIHREAIVPHPSLCRVTPSPKGRLSKPPFLDFSPQTV